MSGTLYVVGTPIGNLQDFSPRALQTLADVDFIAAEDTRVTLKLLTHFGLKKPLVSYYEHNKASQGPVIVARLAAGESCALVTDAGLPAISDPGEALVRLCHQAGVPVVSVPGPSALTAALSVSGMPSDHFYFEGFLSADKKERADRLQRLAAVPCTLLFYEAPHKLAATAQEMLRVFGDRPMAAVRELTKIHEEILPTTLAAFCDRLARQEPRGEYVLIVQGAPVEANDDKQHTLQQALALAARLQEEGLPPTKAAKIAAEFTGRKKGDIYAAMTQNN